ncbi:lipopolysaccharide biosynthesis protein [Shewanella algae]|uniref:lipopolysaccharide biosynthesis protein n=1 Tax=Shewanella algae TaxID=38313 RepID=UPI003AADEAC6
MTPKKIFHFAIGPIGSALLGFLSLPIIAWVFSQEDVGKMALLQVILSFTTLFFTLGLDQGYVREFHESKNRARLLKTVIVPGFLLLLVTLAICLIFGTLLSEKVFELRSTFISWLLSAALLCAFLSRFLSLVLRMNERGLAFSMSQLFPKAFVLIIIIFYLLLDVVKTFEYLLLANTLAIAFTCFILTWNTRKEWSISLVEKINWQELQRLLRFGLPLIIGGVAFWGLTSMDRILLSRWSTYSELAVYSVSVSFAGAAAIFQSVFSTLWAPTVYKWASNDEGYDKVIMVNRYVLLLVIILFCIIGLLSWLVPFLLPKEYSDVQWILVACLAYPLFYTLSETTVVGIGIARKSAYSMFACLLALLVNVVCNYFLIPIFGAAGAASSTAVAFWAFLIFRTEFSIRVWKKLPRLELYSFSFLTLIGALIEALLNNKFGFYLHMYWLMLLCYGVYFFKVDFLSLINHLSMFFLSKKRV